MTAVDLQHDVVLFVTRVTLERLNQLEPWVSAIAGDFDEEALKAEAEEAKKQADALLIDAAKERRHTDRLRLKDHGDVRDRRRRSHSREHDRCTHDYSIHIMANLHFLDCTMLSFIQFCVYQQIPFISCFHPTIPLSCVVMFAYV